MSYFETNPHLGIGTGIGMQAFADIIEYGTTAGQIAPPVKKRARARAGLGACCSACARGEKNCGGLSGLGTVTATLSSAAIAARPPTPPGGSLLKKLLVLGLVGGGGYLAYRKFIKKA